MRLTLAQARKQIEDRELWLWRQKYWGKSSRGIKKFLGEPNDFDYELELSGYQSPGAAADYFEVPNR